MFVVRCAYFNNGSVSFSYSRIFHNVFFARGYAKEKRRVLNCHWCVDVCSIDIASVECVV